MSLPTSRNTTFAVLSEVPSVDLNAIQDWIIQTYRRGLHLVPVDVPRMTGSTIDQGAVAAMGYKLATPAAGGPLLVAAHSATNDIIRSVDGVQWLASADIATFNGVQHHRAVHWSALLAKWVIVTKSGSTNKILTAADPSAAWTVHVDPQIGGADRGGMAENGTNLICPGTVEIFGTSAANDWVIHNSNPSGEIGRAAAWSPSLALFVVVGDNGSVVTSPDGETWTDRSGGLPGSLSAVDFVDVVWNTADAAFHAVGTGGKIARSTDGIDWLDIGVDGTLTEAFTSIAYDGVGMMVAATAGHTLHSFDGGVTWFIQPTVSGLAASPFVIYANGRVVAAGQAPATGHAGVALSPLGFPLAVVS